MSKDAYWFPHDAGARNDPKILKLRRIHGHTGVGVYWYIVEMLREANQDNYELPINSIEDIAYDGRFDVAIFETLFDIDLLAKDEEVFWSESLKRRMSRLDEKRKQRAEAGRKGGLSKAKATLKQSSSVAKAKLKRSSSNKRILHNITEDKSTEENKREKKQDTNINFKLENDNKTNIEVVNTKGNSTSTSLGGFEEFWEVYPKKVGKKAAEKAWHRAMKIECREVVVAAVKVQKNWPNWLKDNGQFIPNPATWLNQGRWEDEILPSGSRGSNLSGFSGERLTAVEQMQKRNEEALRRAWEERYGKDK